MQHLSRLEITGCVRSMRSGESSGSVSLCVKRSGRSSSSVKAREHLHEQWGAAAGWDGGERSRRGAEAEQSRRGRTGLKNGSGDPRGVWCEWPLTVLAKLVLSIIMLSARSIRLQSGSDALRGVLVYRWTFKPTVLLLNIGHTLIGDFITNICLSNDTKLNKALHHSWIFLIPNSSFPFPFLFFFF